MSYTSEQPSSCDFEVCCICMDEFSNDNDLAAHLLRHAEDSAFHTDSGDSSQSESSSSVPTTFCKSSFPEYTKTSLVKAQSMRKSFTRRSLSPEVWEINSDDSGDEQGKSKATVPASRGGSNALPRHNSLPVRPVMRHNSNSQVMGSKAYSQMTPPFNCSVCSSVFTDPKQFRDHLLTHEKPRPYSCHICNKTFAYKGTLRQHLKLHVGDKLHECPKCNKRFTIKAVLKKHCEEMHEIFSV